MKTLVVISLVLSIASGVFPPEFKKCSLKNSNFKACALEAALDGISKLTKPFPQYKLPNIDPLDLPELTMAPGAKGVVAVEQKFKNCKVYGLSKMQLDVWSYDFPKQEFSAEGLIPNLTLKCNYELNGKVLILPIEGKGISTIFLESVKLVMLLPWEETKQPNGQTKIKLLTRNFSVKPNKIMFDFENLFNGDKALGDNINKVLNENWEQVWGDLQEGYEKAIARICEMLTNDFYTTVSKEDAFD